MKEFKDHFERNKLVYIFLPIRTIMIFLVIGEAGPQTAVILTFISFDVFIVQDWINRLRASIKLQSQAIRETHDYIVHLDRSIQNDKQFQKEHSREANRENGWE